VRSTEAGLQINLQTDGTALPTPSTETVGNATILEIPNAVLTLPDGEDYFVANPAEGIALITATTLDGQTLRLSITGENAPPTVQASANGLALTVGLGVAADGLTDEEGLVIGVTGEQGGSRYFVPDALTATRTDTPLEEIPQSIQVIPQEVFEDQGINTLDDATRNVSGVLQNSADARGQRFVIRGFDSASVLRDGFRPTFGFGGNIGYPELANIQQVEVLKGPAAILYGVSEPGGVINLVSEQPLSEPFYEANFELGNRELLSAGIDFSGPLDENGNLLYWLNALYRDSAYYRAFTTDVERAFVAPVLQWNISDNTDLNLFLEYSDNQRPYDTGLVAIGDGVANIPFDRNLSQPEDFNQSTYLLWNGLNGPIGTRLVLQEMEQMLLTP
jgi:iron complex outermembrane receptor protein